MRDCTGRSGEAEPAPSFAGACFTPLEAKGLEFHTVFLLDSFKKTNAAWWTALAADGRFCRLTGEADASTDAPPDPLLSSDLARVAELKQTYVGVTRACVRLFCIDTNEHGRRPFYDLLLKRGYARWHEGDLALDEGLAVAASGEGRRAGDELLARIKEGDESIADRAALCFAKSGDAASEAFCRGVEWRRGALREADEERALDLRLAAACAFARGGALDVCADLLEQLGEAELAEESRNADGTARLQAEARAAERERAEIAGRSSLRSKRGSPRAPRPTPPRTPLSSQRPRWSASWPRRRRSASPRAGRAEREQARAEEQAARAAIARAEAEAAEKRRAEVAKAEPRAGRSSGRRGPSASRRSGWPRRSATPSARGAAPGRRGRRRPPSARPGGASGRARGSAAGGGVPVAERAQPSGGRRSAAPRTSSAWPPRSRRAAPPRRTRRRRRARSSRSTTCRST